MKRVTVTGASGFIGTRLVKQLLADGYQVSALMRGNRTVDSFGSNVRIVRGDVTDADSLSGCFANSDVVIHMAGCTIAPTKGEFDRVNRGGTENVAHACAARTSPPKLLFVSSLAAAGPAGNGQPVVETDLEQPVSDYGRSKLAAETSLRRLSPHLPIQIVRPPAVFGDSDRHMLPLFKYAKWGWVFLPGRSTARYSLIHVDDLVRAIIHISESDNAYEHLTGGVSNEINSNHQEVIYTAHWPALSFPQVAKIVNDELVGRRVRCVPIPSPCCWTLAATNSLIARTTGLRPLLNLDKMREGMAGDWMCDSSRLTDDLGFEFQVSLEQRIRQTAQGYFDKDWI